MEDMEFKFETFKYNQSNENTNYGNDGTGISFDYIYNLVEQSILEQQPKAKAGGKV
jgi:hypothetical protein